MSQLQDKTVEEQIEHSDLLNDEKVEHGAGAVAGYEIDLGFRYGKDETVEDWSKGTDFFRHFLEEKNGWHEHSAGTGFGTRDMQFIRVEPATVQELSDLIQLALELGIQVQYLNHHGINEWREQVNEGDEEHIYGYQQETT